MAPPNPKVRAAFSAMKALGISEDKVKPVLKNLLKLYNKNWQPIEENNYGALIEAVFENGDNEVADQKRKTHSEEEEEDALAEELQRPLKRQRHRSQENQPTVSPEPSVKRTSSTGKEKIGEDNGELPTASHFAAETRGAGHPASQMEKQKNSERANVPTKYTTNLEIASSSLGEIKITLSCNSTLEASGFHMPSLDKVMKMMEDKCQRTYRILDPSFSVKKLMSEMCQCFLELGKVCNDPGGTTIDMEPMQDEPVMQDAGNEDDTVNPPAIASDHCYESTQSIKKHIIDGSTAAVQGTELVLSEGTDPICMILPHCQATSTIKDSLYQIEDISNGEERTAICCVNEIDNQNPPSLRYTPESLVFDCASVSISLAQIDGGNCCLSCSGDCLSSIMPCACALANGGELAYTARGLVKESFLDKCIAMTRESARRSHFYCQECPLERSKGGTLQACNGHLKRNFIKECWRKCGCNRRCGNRVVQRGISCSLQVFMTEGKGWGLRTLDGLPKGAYVCEYVGEILTNHEVQMRNVEGGKETYQVILDSGWDNTTSLKDDEVLCLDTTCYANVARFINHRCNDANLIEIPVEVESPKRHYYHLAFFTTRNVQALEELTWDYGIDFEGDDQSSDIFQCLCGSESCRNRKSSGAIMET